jgi:hypothetical protein
LVLELIYWCSAVVLGSMRFSDSVWFAVNFEQSYLSTFLKIIPQSPLHLDSPYLRIKVDPVGYGYDKVRDDYKLIRYVDYFRLRRDECEEIDIPYI